MLTANKKLEWLQQRLAHIYHMASIYRKKGNYSFSVNCWTLEFLKFWVKVKRSHITFILRSLTIGYLSSYESFTEVNVWLDKNKKITDESFCKADTKSIKDAQFIQINPIWEEKISQYNSMVIKNEKEEGDYFLHFCLPKNSGGKSEKFKILSIIWNWNRSKAHNRHSGSSKTIHFSLSKT